MTIFRSNFGAMSMTRASNHSPYLKPSASPQRTMSDHTGLPPNSPTIPIICRKFLYYKIPTNLKFDSYHVLYYRKATESRDLFDNFILSRMTNYPYNVLYFRKETESRDLFDYSILSRIGYFFSFILCKKSE
jgi:hypothetical protein